MSGWSSYVFTPGHSPCLGSLPNHKVFCHPYFRLFCQHQRQEEQWWPLHGHTMMPNGEAYNHSQFDSSYLLLLESIFWPPQHGLSLMRDGAGSNHPFLLGCWPLRLLESVSLPPPHGHSLMSDGVGYNHPRFQCCRLLWQWAVPSVEHFQLWLHG